MNPDPDLLDALRRLAAALPREAEPAVAQRLLAAFPARRRRRSRMWIAAVAAAACFVLVMALTVSRRPPASPQPIYLAPGFVALPYSQSGVPLENAVVIRVQLRPEELTSLGVGVPAAAAAKLNVDVLVGQDGVARAVRLLR